MIGCISELRLDGRLVNFWHESRESFGLTACDTCHTRRLQLARFRYILDNKHSQLERQNRFKLTNEYTKTSDDNKTYETIQNNTDQDTIKLVESLNPCQNHGICQEALSSNGQRCICSPGFSGTFCERFGQSCYPGVCGSGRCVHLLPNQLKTKISQNGLVAEAQSTLQCDCPLGRSGNRCQNRAPITQLRFTGVRSFASYLIPKDSAAKLSVRIRLKPNLSGRQGSHLRDQLLLYSAEQDNGFGDFFALTIRSRKLQFQFNTGSGTGIVASDFLQIKAGGWLYAHVQRQFNEGRLIVSGPIGSNLTSMEQIYQGRAPGRTKGSSLRLPMFVGGVDEQLVQLPIGLQGLSSFSGCIGQLEINDQMIDMIGQVVDSSNVKNCAEISPCSEHPCENGGICVEQIRETKNNESLPLSYRCLCKEPFTGDHCHYNRGFCALNKPCQNQGVCLEKKSGAVSLGLQSTLTKGGYKCCCSIGYTGSHCEVMEPVNQPTCVSFDASSFLVLDRKLLPHNSSQEEEVIEFTFRTQRFSGLLFYQGDPELEDRDFLIIALIDGHLEAIWELGSGPGLYCVSNALLSMILIFFSNTGVIKSEEPLNDGRRHHVIFKRKGQEGQLAVDILNPVFGRSGPGLTQLNADADLYIGGHPEIDTISPRKTQLVGFSGLIGNIRLQNSMSIDLYNSAKLTCNVRPCDQKTPL